MVDHFDFSLMIVDFRRTHCDVDNYITLVSLVAVVLVCPLSSGGAVVKGIKADRCLCNCNMMEVTGISKNICPRLKFLFPSSNRKTSGSALTGHTSVTDIKKVRK